MNHKILLQPRGLTIEARPGETLLEAGQRLGFKMLHSCDNGVCEVCQVRLLAGSCQLRNRATRVQAGETPADELLLCLAEAESDCTIEIHTLLAPGEYAVRRLACQVSSIEALGADIYRVRLLAPAGRKLEFNAGQYLVLEIPGVEGAFFSIANAPDGRQLELHVEAPAGRGNAVEILRYLQENPTVRVELPFGRACLTEIPNEPVILVAAGTGFAQIKSIAEQLLAQGFSAPLHIYWGTRTLSEMYMRVLPEQWQQQYANVFFVPIAADNADSDWQGHHEELCNAVSSRHEDVSNCRVFVSGSPTMVYTLYDCLAEKGLNQAHFYSDVLEYAPRG